MKKHVLFNILILSLFCAFSVFSAAMAEDTENDFRTVGSFVTFGTYPQTAEGTDNTPIEWLVLDYDEENNRALLISRYGLDCQPYNTDYVDVTWETCTLRTWMNDTFLNKAFSTEEQKAIVLTDVDNSKSQCYSEWKTNGGNDTQDQVFLLSYAEANRYFKIPYNDDNNTQARVAPTEHAILQGAYTSSSYKSADGLLAGWWWLRSPSPYQDGAASVYSDGCLAYDSVSGIAILVRPALWVNLNLLPDMNTKVAEFQTTEPMSQEYAVDSHVTYGTYPQTADGTDNTPIEWLVLDYDEENNRALLISRYGLDCRPYNTAYADITWETCTLRTWLNDDFLNKAFSKEEQKAILLTDVDNSEGQCYSGYSTYGGNNTQDKIFLLSYTEANKYFNVQHYSVSGFVINIKSRIVPTAYAMSQGAWTYSDNKTADGLASGEWWLRSPGFDQKLAVGVAPSGGLFFDGVSYFYLSVRPAFWLDLSGMSSRSAGSYTDD